MKALIKNPDTTFGVPLITAYICYNCEYLQVETNRYSSSGPKCAECGERLTSYKIQQQ